MIGQLGKALLVMGASLAAIGLLLILAGRLGIGRLPGDLVWKGKDWAVYVPLGWMILLSVVLTLLLNLFGRGK